MQDIQTRGHSHMTSMTRILILFLLFVGVLCAQSNSGELRLKVTDPSGLGVKTTVQITSEANHYQNALATDGQGYLDVQRLPYGVYQLEIKEPGFAGVSESIEIRSSIPRDEAIQLKVSQVEQSVVVTSADTLIDPDQAGSVNQVGTQLIQDRLGSLPGRSIQDLVNSQPGWLYEGNAVLHPRGSEYQTQFVVDGIPLTDNRSPSFGPEIEADDIQSMSIYTAGIPAEYGRKMGGVVEVNTLQDAQDGFHGQVVLSGGSFDSAGSFAEGQYVWGKNTFGASASGSMTDHYLNPVVPQNFTNSGTTGDFSVHYQRDLTPKDRLSLDRSPRARPLRASERAGAGSRRTATDGGQLRNDGHHLLPAHVFIQCRSRLSRHGPRQLERLQLQRIFDACRGFPAQLVSRGIFQGQHHH